MATFKEEAIKKYEDVMIKLALSSAMEIEGKELEEKRLDLEASTPKTPEAALKDEASLRAIMKEFDHHQKKQQRKSLWDTLLQRKVPLLYRMTPLIAVLLIILTCCDISLLSIPLRIASFFTGTSGQENSVTDSPSIDLEEALFGTWEEGYIPGFIPSKFEIRSITNQFPERTIVLSNEKEQLITFHQYEGVLDDEPISAVAETPSNISQTSPLITHEGSFISIAWEEDPFVIEVSGIGVQEDILMDVVNGVTKKTR